MGRCGGRRGGSYHSYMYVAYWYALFVPCCILALSMARVLSYHTCLTPHCQNEVTCQITASLVYIGAPFFTHHCFTKGLREGRVRDILACYNIIVALKGQGVG